MIKDSFSFIANYLWRESITNLKKHLTESELQNFNSNDYYYLTTIYYMKRPNFSQVAETLKLTKPAISAMIRKLTKMDLVEKIQSLEDKRVFYLNVTEKGRLIIDGDEELYLHIDLLIKEFVNDNEKYSFIESLLEKIVRDLTKTDK